MNRFAAAERHGLADALEAAGPDAPTLCAGWRTRQLAAHVVVRERRPDAAAGLVLPWLRGHTDRVTAVRAGAPYPQLVDAVRTPPWWSPVSNPLLDSVANAAELFVHHEDVRRGRGGWLPRDLPGAYQARLWRHARTLARWRLRHCPAVVLCDAPGFGQCRVGRGGPRVRLVGAPAELLLFLTGRQRATHTEVTGPADLTARLRCAGFGR